MRRILKKCLIDFYTKKFEELNSRLSIEFSSIEIEQELKKLTSNQACQLEECKTGIFGIPLKPALKAAWFDIYGSTNNALEICMFVYEKEENRDVYVGRKLIHLYLSQKNFTKALEVSSKLKNYLNVAYKDILLKIDAKRLTPADKNRGEHTHYLKILSHFNRSQKFI